MLVINDRRVDISFIRNYKGQDLLLKELKYQTLHLENKYFQENFDNSKTVKFRFRKGIIKYNKKSKRKEGKRLEAIPLVVTYANNDGDHTVRYCESMIKEREGVYDYSPRRLKFTGRKICKQNQMDLILFMTMFANEYKSGLIVLEDIGEDNKRLERERAKQSGPSFYIYHEMSPLAGKDGEVKLKKLAMQWGVSEVYKKAIPTIKNQLFNAIEAAEKKQDKDFDIEAFVKAVNKDNPFLKINGLIQEAVDLGVIEYRPKSLQWKFMDFDKQEIHLLAKISPTEATRNRHALMQILAVHQDKKEELQEAINNRYEALDKLKLEKEREIEHGKGEEVPGTLLGTDDDIDRPFDRTTDFNKIPWKSIRRAAQLAELPMYGKKKDDLIKLCFAHYKNVEPK